MEQNKELLLRYLCMALPYKIVIDYNYNAFEMRKGNYVNCIKQGSKCLLNCDLLDIFISPRQNENGEYIKPYLRPISSMTKEEDRIRIDLGIWKSNQYDGQIIGILQDVAYANPLNFQSALIWLLQNHFDIFGLIPKGLAIAVNEENNPYK